MSAQVPALVRVTTSILPPCHRFGGNSPGLRVGGLFGGQAQQNGDGEMNAHHLPHPTPAHVALRVLEAMEAEAKRRGENTPLWIDQAISEGVKRACAEHDEAAK